MAIAVEAALAGKRIIWGAPVYDQVRIGWDEARRAASGVADFNTSRMTADFGRGAIVFRSLDNPDSTRGHSADGVVMDECGDLDPTAWTDVLRPMLLDTGGWSWGVGSPNGRNWFWREWLAAKDRDDSAAWQAPTLGVRYGEHGLERAPHPLENPRISFDEIRRLAATMPERTFRQEILAEFNESGNSVLRRVAEAATAEPQDRIDGHYYVAGVDWAREHDYTVISVIDATTRTQVHLDRYSQVEYAVQIARLTAVHDAYRPAAILAEANAMGGPLVEQLQRLGWPVRPWTATNATKAALVDGLALALERGDVTLLRDEAQTAELEAFTSERLPSGLVRYTAPEGMHDDTVIALALAWEACTSTSPRREPQSYGLSAGEPRRPEPAERTRAFRGRGVDPFAKAG